ncbi:unnamed protein product [Nippostrongylus brasiliensis]|uniref:Secreted protein n=1 Tax=Nippostrongylus brasiliensis TaxID=27835 RepID=A0A0N4XDT1_NIPBR|nr:unnamed protein product [Nippostrongylus brasiliensis]
MSSSLSHSSRFLLAIYHVEQCSATDARGFQVGENACLPAWLRSSISQPRRPESFLSRASLDHHHSSPPVHLVSDRPPVPTPHPPLLLVLLCSAKAIRQGNQKST